MNIKASTILIAVGLILPACGYTTLPADLIATETSLVVIPASTIKPSILPSASLTPQPTATYSPHSIGPDNFPKVVNPLTGLTVDNPSILNRRPVSIKVSNYPRSSRPQWGLSMADIVYEYYHNNDLTRFNAIFYSKNASMVGPIRSGRLFDDYLVQLYKSDFVFASADSRILDHFKEQKYADRLIYLLDGGCPPTPVCRYDPAGSYSLVASTAEIRKFLQKQGVKDNRQILNGMVFSQLVPSGGQDITRINLRYSYSAYLYWEFDPSTGRYLRYQDTQEDILGAGETYALLIDRLTNQPIAADNVVVLEIPHCHAVYKPPEGGVAAIEIVDMDFVGSGRAFAFRDGEVYEVKWMRPQNNWVLYLELANGAPYFMKPGTTWFQVITDISTLSAQGESIQFNFNLKIPPRMCPLNSR